MSDIKNIQIDGIDYAIKDEVARNNIGDLDGLDTTERGSLVAAINEAYQAGGPIKRIVSSSNNYVYLRDLESGVYILYGYFRPYNGAASRLAFDNVLVSVAADDTGSHILVFSTVNSMVDFISIEVDDTQTSGFAYSRTNISLLELYGLIEKVEAIVASNQPVVTLTQEEYLAMRDAGEINPETIYMIARDDL